MFIDSTFSNVIVIIISLIVSIVIHEYMHGYVAHLLGDTTASDEGRLSLNPLKHIDPVMTILLPIISFVIFHFPVLAAKPVPFNPERLKYDEFGVALVAAGGPFSNLLMVIISGFMVNHVFAAGSFLASAFTIFTVINVALFVFNMIPISPLDGSRILYAFSPEPVQRLLMAIEPYGIFIVIALVMYGPLGGILSNVDQSVLNLLP